MCVDGFISDHTPKAKMPKESRTSVMQAVATFFRVLRAIGSVAMNILTGECIACRCWFGRRQ